MPEGYTWPEGTNPISEIPPGYDLFEDMAVQVKLVAVPNGDEPRPVISPKVCINAQTEYKKATWKATVLPTGTTASLEVLSGNIKAEPLSQIKNNTKIKITGNGTGKYKIKLTHDSLPSCYTEEESVVFVFYGASKLSSATPTSVAGPGIISWSHPIYSISMGEAEKRKIQSVNARVSIPYIIKTLPGNAYSGNLSCPINIASAGTVPYILATGIIQENKAEVKDASTDFVDFTEDMGGAWAAAMRTVALVRVLILDMADWSYEVDTDAVIHWGAYKWNSASTKATFSIDVGSARYSAAGLKGELRCPIVNVTSAVSIVE